jgi:hypothetical protein
VDQSGSTAVLTMRTMSKGNEHPQAVQDDLGVHGLKIVELAEILDGRDPVLVVLVVVGLEQHLSQKMRLNCERTSNPYRTFSSTVSITLTAKSEWNLLMSYSNRANRLMLAYLAFQILTKQLRRR